MPKSPRAKKRPFDLWLWVMLAGIAFALILPFLLMASRNA
jgi:hypothetical protein